LRILVADDHEAVRRGVCAILGSREDLEVCGEACDGQEAIDKTRELNPDLIILDISMPVLSGLDAAGILRNTFPLIPVVMLSMHESKGVVEEARRIGVQGYVTKSQAGMTLLAAVDAVLRKDTFFPEDTRS
jgi:two-component system nitrate/nitrite response regulator NarL